MVSTALSVVNDGWLMMAHGWFQLFNDGGITSLTMIFTTNDGHLQLRAIISTCSTMGFHQ